MTVKITPDTAEERLERLLTPHRASERRRHELERLANFCSPRDVRVSVQLDSMRALCRPAPESTGLEVLIPTKAYAQPQTEYPRRVWDRKMQVALLFHELGHALYSDFETFGQRLEEVKSRWRSLFRTVYNAAEDGAVETQVATEFRVEDDLTRLNRALSTIAARRHEAYVELFESTDAPQTYTVYEAIRQGILDGGFESSGLFAAIRDPEEDEHQVRNGRGDVVRRLAGRIESYTRTMCSTPDPTERVEAAYELFEELRPVFEELPPLQRQRVGTAAVRPQDTNGYSSWRARRARALGDDEDAGGTSGTVPGESVGEDDWVVDSPQERESPSPRAVGDRSALQREATRLLEIVSEPETVSAVRIPDPVDNADVVSRYERIVDETRELTEALRSQLRRERRPNRRHGTRFGRLDGRRIVAAARGRERVFSRMESASDLNYTCLFVLDRSGSMEGDQIAAAETAVTALTHSLTTVGVSVGVLSVWEGQVCLEHPFGGTPSKTARRLLSERTGGQTPLTDAIATARNRIHHGEGTQPFIVVLTDGEPDDEDAYREQLNRCSVPVYGVYLGERLREHAELFDRIEYTDPASVRQDLSAIARRLFGGKR